MPLPKESEKDVGISGFAAIKKVRGLLVGIDEQDQPETWEGTGKVVRIDLEEAAILEMFDDEEVFELKDGKFGFLYPYKLNQSGKITPNTPYDKCWLASARELGKVPSQFIGEYVTLEKQPRLLFQTYEMEEVGGKKKPKLNEAGEKIKKDVHAVNESGRAKYFCFVKDEDADSDTVKTKVAEKLVGLNEQAALRSLLINFKQNPEFKDSLKAKGAEVFAVEIGLVFTEGKFQKPEST